VELKFCRQGRDPSRIRNEVNGDADIPACSTDDVRLFFVVYDCSCIAALQAKSFDKFYGRISELWQKEITADKLQEVFQAFINKEIDLTPIAKVEPVFDGTSAVNDDGLLVIKGSYPTKPSKVFFELKYVYEDESWKMGAINVQVKPTGEKDDKNKADDDE